MARAQDQAAEGGATSRRDLTSEQLVLPGLTHPLDPVRRHYMDLRRLHPELRRELTWSGARAILRRLRIALVYAPLPRPAAIISDGSETVILINSNIPARRHTYYVAHELAHYFRHTPDGDSPCYHMDPDWGDHDPREDEAEYLAMLMLGGRLFERYI